MEQEFKVGDCVQLKHGATPTMTISQIWPELKEAECVWHDPKKVGEMFKKDIPLSVLKHCVTQQQINDIVNEIIPPRN